MFVFAKNHSRPEVVREWRPIQMLTWREEGFSLFLLKQIEVNATLAPNVEVRGVGIWHCIDYWSMCVCAIHNLNVYVFNAFVCVCMGSQMLFSSPTNTTTHTDTSMSTSSFTVNLNSSALLVLHYAHPLLK